jgi:16S rRNA processing protein RimM
LQRLLLRNLAKPDLPGRLRFSVGKRTEGPADPVVIGRIVKPVGIRGEVKVIFTSGEPDRLQGVENVTIRTRHGFFDLQIRSQQCNAGYARIHFDDVNDPDEAEILRNAEIVIDSGELPALSSDEFYVDQIIGSRAISDTGEELGKLEEILNLGSRDVWVVRGPQGEILVPAPGPFIESVDLSAKLIVLKSASGLWGSDEG